MSNAFKFYGVYTPSDLNKNDEDTVNVFESYEDTLRYCKENRKARFKGFNSQEEAIIFSKNGAEGGIGNPSCLAESLPFGKLRSQDLVTFRKCIQAGDIVAVKKLLWKNPRYLISEGDGVTVLQEGARYNPLHVAATSGHSKIAEFLLSTISDPIFTKLLYGIQSENSYLARSEQLLDLLLNTPDKSANETPLHFAAKYGATEVVKILVSYPQCQKDRRNKHGERPIDIICNRVTSKSALDVKQVKKEIAALLEDGYFVPVWRSEDNIIQAIIGQPFSPKSPPSDSLIMDDSPLSPVMHIKAVAGPMSYESASEFRKKWKTPPRQRFNNQSSKNHEVGTPHPSFGILDRDTLDIDKGVEKVGRILADEYKVTWKEYWAFLNKFIDLRSEEGLTALEGYLKNKIMKMLMIQKYAPAVTSVRSPIFEDTSPSPRKVNNSFISQIYQLCDSLKSFSIKSPVFSQASQSSNNDHYSPKWDLSRTFQFIENTCMQFTTNIIEKFGDAVFSNQAMEDIVIFLVGRVRCFLMEMDTYEEEAEFQVFPFKKVHKRVGHLIAYNLCSKLTESSSKRASSIFDLIGSMDNDMIAQAFTDKTKVPISSETNKAISVLKCIADEVTRCLKNDVNHKILPKDESECIQIWSSVNKCSCAAQCATQSRCVSSSVVQCVTPTTCSSSYTPQCDTPARCVNVRSVRKKMIFEAEEDEDDAGNNTEDINTKDCHSDDGSDDDEFYTPLVSPADSDNEMMYDGDEGSDIFVYGDKGTKFDLAVLDALNGVEIDPSTYPCICRWKHSMLLLKNRNIVWETPSVSSLKKRSVTKFWTVPIPKEKLLEKFDEMSAS